MNENQNKPRPVSSPSQSPQTSHPAKSEREQSKAEQVYSILAKDHPTMDEFKLLLTSVSTGVLAKRYLHTGLPKVFENEPHKYLAFREALGRVFKVPSQNIVVMGSARFGFSTSPTKQEYGEKKLDENSDMDLVIISSEIFADALRSFAEYSFRVLRDINELKSDPKGAENVSIPKQYMVSIRRRAKSLSFGYVNPSDFENGTTEKQEFYDMKREAGTLLLGTAPPGPISRVGAWIYKDWDAAERMYEFSFNQLAKSWGVQPEDEDLLLEDPLTDK